MGMAMERVHAKECPWGVRGGEWGMDMINIHCTHYKILINKVYK